MRFLLSRALALVIGVSSLLTPTAALAGGGCSQPVIMQQEIMITGPNSLTLSITADQPVAWVFADSVNLGVVGIYEARFAPSQEVSMKRTLPGNVSFATIYVRNECGSKSEFPAVFSVLDSKPWVISPHFDVRPPRGIDNPILGMSHAATFCVANCHEIVYNGLGQEGAGVTMQTLTGRPFRLAIPWNANVALPDGNDYILLIHQPRKPLRYNCVFRQRLVDWGGNSDHDEFWTNEVTLWFERIVPGSETARACGV